MTNSALDGKPYAGNPHVRIDEGDGASAKPRRSSLLYKSKYLAVVTLALGIAAAVFAGPRTSVQEFFGRHLDAKVSERIGISAKMAAGDVAGAEKVFADFIRATLKPDVLNRDWIVHPYTRGEMRKLKASVDKTMSYLLSSCGTPHQFPKGKIDWDANPTFNQYKEWTWQLSRHPFWTDLAQYYTMTNDEAVAQVWVDQISSWFDQAICPEKAPSGATHCWRTIEAGIRMSGWSRQIHAFLRSPAVTDEFLTRYFISIWEHGWRLRNNSTHGNWLLMELHGLLRISLLYPFLQDATEWKAYALKLLEEEFSRQVYPDGFQYELATGYHGVVISNYLGIFELYDILGLEKPEFVRKGLENMFDVYVRLGRPDGNTPDLNDGGHMNVAGWLRKAKDMYPARQDFLWFTSAGAMGERPDYLSCVFPYAGAVVFRSSWEKDAVWGYLDGSPFGRGHQHEDKLNFLMSAYGKEMLTEGGNYMYDSSECRKYVLSTRAHNTIRIDGLDQARRRTYRWKDEDIFKKADVTFSTTSARDEAACVFKDGYGKNLLAVEHARKVLFLKAEEGLSPFFVVIDRLTAPDEKDHAFELPWHLETSQLTINGTVFTADFGKGVGLVGAQSDPSVKIVDMKGQHEPYFQGWMPIWKGGPHEHRPIPTPVVQGSFRKAWRGVTVLYPYRNGEKKVVGVKASGDVGDKTLRLVLADGSERTVSE